MADLPVEDLSANAAIQSGVALSDEDKLYTISVTPLGGYYDLGNEFVVPTNGLTESINNTFEHFALEKRFGSIALGQTLADDITPYWGGQYMMSHPKSPPETRMTQLRVNGINAVRGRLYKLNDDDILEINWRWVGVVSGTEQGTNSDNITSGFTYATAIVQAFRLFVADGGVDRKCCLYTPGTTPRIVSWGLNVGVPAAGVINTESGPPVVDGFLLTDRNYGFVYQLIDEVSGFKSQIATPSNVFLTTIAGDNITLNCTIPAFASLPAGTYTVRIGRSTGSVPPSVPQKYLFERDYTGITNLATTPLSITLKKFDGDLGDEILDVYPLAPRGKFVMLDPSGDSAIIFADPTNPNVAYWSDPGQYGNWQPVNQTLPIDNDLGDPLNGGFCGLNGRVFIMKFRRGIYEMIRTVNGAYSPVKLTDSYGCWSHYSIVDRGDTVYWMSREGVVAFSGQEPVNISDDKIRDFITRISNSSFGDNNDLFLPYAVKNRKPGVNTIEWIVRDPDQESIHVLIYDTVLKNWTIRDIAFAAAGGAPRISWTAYQSRLAPTGIGGIPRIITADGAGRCFSFYNLPSDVLVGNVYADNGTALTWSVKTAWFGNGLLKYIPRYFDFIQRVQARVADAIGVSVSLYVNGSDTAVQTRTFEYPFSNVYTDRKFVRFRFRCISLKSPVTMFRFGLTQANDERHGVFIPWYETKFNIVSPRLRGVDTGE